MTYIDREAFLASNVFLVAGTLDDYDQGYMDGVDAVEEAVKEFPAADVRPVVHGKWEEATVDYMSDVFYDGDPLISSMRCNKCDHYYNRVYSYGDPKHFANYCPYCGANMDLEKEKN